MQVWKFAAVGTHVAVMFPFKSRATVVEALGLLSGVDSRMSDVRLPTYPAETTQLAAICRSTVTFQRSTYGVFMS